MNRNQNDSSRAHNPTADNKIRRMPGACLVAPSRYSTAPLTSSPLEIIASLHRGTGASVVFHLPDVKTMHGASPASRLREMWSAIADRAASGACFFSINSCGSCRPYEKVPSKFFASRKAEHLSYLNALYVDIDRHEEYPDVDLDLLAAQALRTSDFLRLPSPTWAVKTGRGVWLLWIFTDPIQATLETRDQWQVMAESLADAFQSLRPDRESSITINRIMRTPNSRNLEAGGYQVKFSMVGQAVNFYDMAKCLGVTPRPTPITRAEHARKPKNAAKVLAARARWKKTYQGLEKLIQLRRMFLQGDRSWAVFHLAQSMTRAGMPDDEIKNRCFYLGLNQCNPPLDRATITRKIDSGKSRPTRRKGGRLCYSSLGEIRRRFSVTEDELKCLPELMKRQRPQSKKARVMAAIFLILSKGSHLPPPNELLWLLKADGHSVSRTTLWRYRRGMSGFKTAARTYVNTNTVLAENLKHRTRPKLQMKG